MDNRSDDTISFDENGNCNYCNKQYAEKDNKYFPNEEGEKRLISLVHTLKEEGEGKEYDCLMGLSGGLDSSYLAYLGHKLGLRILGIHVDDGFDTDITKSNLANLAKSTNINLIYVQPDLIQYYGLTKAFMKAGIPNLAIAQDNVFTAFLYKYAKSYKIKYFLSGGNFALECILQKGNTYNAEDVVHIKHLNKVFGKEKIDKLTFMSSWQKYFYKYFGGIKTVRPLDYVDYNRDKAFNELHSFCDFQYYGSKHLENILTAFLQLYWMPIKFNVDKRTSHLSSMIVSGQLTRNQALEELEKPLCNDKVMNEYISIIKEKLIISDEEFEKIMTSPGKQHTEYKHEVILPLLRKVLR